MGLEEYLVYCLDLAKWIRSVVVVPLVESSSSLFFGVSVGVFFLFVLSELRRLEFYPSLDS